MVFLVERYNGHPFCKATWNEECAKDLILSSVLYIPKAIPGDL